MSRQDTSSNIEEYLEDLIGTEDEVNYSADPLEILIAQEEKEELNRRIKFLLDNLK